jgi:hypothetical protein
VRRPQGFPVNLRLLAGRPHPVWGACTTGPVVRGPWWISVISEPHPVPEARELFPDELADMPNFLCFLFFVLHAG